MSDKVYVANQGQFYTDIPGMLANFEGTDRLEPDSDGLIHAPLLTLADAIVLPYMVVPLFFADDAMFTQISELEPKSILIGTEDETGKRIPIAVEAAVGQVVETADGGRGVFIQARRRVKLQEIDSSVADALATASAKPIDEEVEVTSEQTAHMRIIIDQLGRMAESSHRISDEMYLLALHVNQPSGLADLVSAALPLDFEQQTKLLTMTDASDRMLEVSTLLLKEIEVMELEQQIYARVQGEVEKLQRENYLREQVRAIQAELGEDDPHIQDIAELRTRIEEAAMPEEIKKKAFKEITRLERMVPIAPEAAVARTYIEWLAEVPWHAQTEDNLDVKHAQNTLDEDHYGLKKAKERVLEYMAVRTLAPDSAKAPILCFVGPPGTGKTSMGKSIARALGREFVRLSLGGVRDEAEIRGHRRTYIGALPGRIIQTIKRAGTVNPLIMLDEIDKLGMDYHGDPASALLEVLDPEQNQAFSDHYLEVDYDLSKVLFVTTANYLDTLPDALLDRLEVIEFPGYTEHDKIEIARRFLIPKQMEANGIKDQTVTFETSALEVIIHDYTYEAGVRNLERQLATICRKIARRVAEDKAIPKRITSKGLKRYLGPSHVQGPVLQTEPELGLAQGLAWTDIGGDILPVEVTLMPGKGNLTLTGQLGEVMQESAQAALSFTRSRSDEFEIDPELFENTDIHIHLPEGAVPKDGPSAGVTLATALISAFTNRPTRPHLVMTGEITLRGRVLPIGGLRNKALAAYRVGITDIIIPTFNKNHISELPKSVQKGMNFILVDHMDEVLDYALLDPIEDEHEATTDENDSDEDETPVDDKAAESA